jgi:hypothetical protein
MKHGAWLFGLLVIATLAASSGCDRASGESARSEPSRTERAEGASSSTSIASIVFVDQAQACDCTRRRIEGSWAALQAALGQDSGIAVERIHRDTQEEQAEEYRLLRPMVTVPGIYLLDEGGAVVELLQGEVTEEQVRTALRRRS